MLATPLYPYMPSNVYNRNQLGRLRGLGIIATPTYPYDPHSVWNRNQLGDLTSILSSPVNLAIAGGLAYVLVNMFMDKKKLF